MYRDYSWKTNLLFILVLLSFTCSPLSAQESDREVNPVGLGALFGLALGQDLPSIGWAAGAGAAAAVIAVDAVDDFYRSSQTQNLNRPRAKATYRKVGPSQNDQADTLAMVQEEMGPENYLGYQALRNCEFDRAYALATAGTLSKNEDHRIVGYWLEAMIAVDHQNLQRAHHTFQSLIELDPKINSLDEAGSKTNDAVSKLREERRVLGLPDCP